MSESTIQTPEKDSLRPEQIVAQADTVSRAIVERLVPAIAGLNPNARAKAVRDVAIIGSNAITGVYFLLCSDTEEGALQFVINPEIEELMDALEADAREIEKTQIFATTGSDDEIHPAYPLHENDLPVNRILKMVNLGGKRPASQSVAVMRTDQYIEMAHGAHTLISEIVTQNPGVHASEKFQKLMQENLAIIGDYYDERTEPQ